MKRLFTNPLSFERFNCIPDLGQGYLMALARAKDLEMTIDLACSLPLDIAGFHPLRITPGTEIYTDLVQAGVIAPAMDYSGMGHHYFVRSYCPVPDDEMRRLYRKAYARFYGRPKIVLNLLRRIRSRAQLRTVANGIGRLIRKPAGKFDPRLRHCEESSTKQSSRLRARPSAEEIASSKTPRNDGGPPSAWR